MTNVTLNETTISSGYGHGVAVIEKTKGGYLVQCWFTPNNSQEHYNFHHSTKNRDMAWKASCLFSTVLKEEWDTARMFLRGYTKEKLIYSRSGTGFAVFVSELSNGEFKVVKAETDIEPRVITDYYPNEAWALAEAASFVKDNEEVEEVEVINTAEVSSGGDLCHYRVAEEVLYDRI